MNYKGKSIDELGRENEILKKKLEGNYKNNDGEYDPLLVDLGYLKRLETENEKLKEQVEHMEEHCNCDVHCLDLYMVQMEK